MYFKLIFFSVGRRVLIDLNSADDNDKLKLTEQIIANYILNKSVQSVIMLQLFSYTDNLNELRACCKSTYTSLFSCDIEEVYFNSKINRYNWNKERKYRITGSRCYSIYTYKGKLIYSLGFQNYIF